VIVNHRYKFIFVKTRKTAGTSIEIALSKHCDDGDLITSISPDDEKLRSRRAQHHTGFKSHMPAFYARGKLRECWDEYFTFCFERNPFDKFISDYYWNMSGRKKLGVDTMPLNRWKAGAQRRSNWPIYARGNNILVDFVGRYETLEEDMASVCETLGLPSLDLPHAKSHHRKDHRHYSEVLNEITRKMIEKSCAKEIAEFGYQWEDV
jgi:hypothetical protein